METFRISVSLSVSLDLSTFLSVFRSLVDFTLLPPFHFVAFPPFPFLSVKHSARASNVSDLLIPRLTARSHFFKIITLAW